MTDYFQLAKSKEADDDLQGAVSLYRQAIDVDPNDFRSLNNLGNVLDELGQSKDALEHYKQAAALTSEHSIVHYNLARAHHRAGQLNDAVASYQVARNLDPHSFDTLFNFGVALHEQGRLESALLMFGLAIGERPNHPEVHSHLGSTLFDLGQYAEAAAAYERSANLNPDSPDIYFHLGKIDDIRGRTDAALIAYRRSLELNPRSSVVNEAIARLLYKTQQYETLAKHFDAWRSAIPADPIAQHTEAAMFDREIGTRASDDYVRQVFDSFASNFDATLQRLSYRGPQLIKELVDSLYPSPAGGLDILDAGCGTGLTGPLLATYAKRLIGVDLSEEMLAKANLRDCYDELINSELTKHMNETPGSYDLIVAADTFNYFGELVELFTSAFQTLRPGGHVAFSLENDWADTAETTGKPRDSQTYRLNAHGRYSHHSDYARQQLAAVGFHHIDVRTGVLRRESGSDVQGLLFTAQRPT